MNEKFPRPRRRGRLAGVLVALAALFSTLVAAVGAAPAAAATETAWIPLNCGLAGAIPVHVGAALKATLPDSVAPGSTFNMSGVQTTVVFPPAAQQSAAVFGGNAVEGTVADFETHLTNATASFAPATVNGTPNSTVSSAPDQFNSVGAVQPPNAAATNAHINGGDTTRGGFQPATPLGTFSFGDAPADTTGASGNSYAPAPGTGGGFTFGNGTYDTLPDIGPITVTGAAGSNVTIEVQNPNGPTVAGNQGGGPRVAQNTVSFHTSSGSYTGQFPADCAYDTTANAIASPDPTFVTSFSIPIVAGPPPAGTGDISARGTDTGGDQFSAIVNCDASAPVKPFYVKSGSTTYKLTSITTSSCTNDGSGNENTGSGTATINGSGSAAVSWDFVDGSPDSVHIAITGGPTIDASPPGALSGTPGGVWARPTNTWPASGGTT